MGHNVGYFVQKSQVLQNQIFVRLLHFPNAPIQLITGLYYFALNICIYICIYTYVYILFNICFSNILP